MSEPDFTQALNTYYNLKSEYESNNNKMKKKIIANKMTSWKEKHKEFRKLKYKCINCNRPVGTIFNISFQKDDNSRIAKAMCGDRTNPCPLNIELSLGSTRNMTHELHEEETKIREIRNEIIRDKNDLLFGYMSAPDAVAKFDKIKEQLNEATSSYEIVLSLYTSIVDNQTIKGLVDKLLLDIHSDTKLIEEYVVKYEREQNTDFINDLVTLYITQLSTKVQELRRLTYPYCAVEKLDNECVLVQRTIITETMEVDMADKPRGVIQFETGDKLRQRNKLAQGPATERRAPREAVEIVFDE
jgi:hypothetical protein